MIKAFALKSLDSEYGSITHIDRAAKISSFIHGKIQIVKRHLHLKIFERKNYLIVTTVTLLYLIEGFSLGSQTENVSTFYPGDDVIIKFKTSFSMLR